MTVPKGNIGSAARVPERADPPLAVRPTAFRFPALGPEATTGRNSQSRLQLQHSPQLQYAVASMTRWTGFTPGGGRIVRHPLAPTRRRISIGSKGNMVRISLTFVDSSREPGPRKAFFVLLSRPFL